MVQLQRISPRWTECIVAATGPSLTEDVSKKCQGRNVIAVSDAYRIMPYAQILYSCDAGWWRVHNGCPDFRGEKWSTHGSEKHNNKLVTAQTYGVQLVQGRGSDTFSTDPGVIHYGSCSGFQAVNLAILMGAKRIVLVGFDMRVSGKRHFFGDHPEGLSNSSRYEQFIPAFKRAARKIPQGVEIINCTPKSALTCFRMEDLDQTLSSSA